PHLVQVRTIETLQNSGAVKAVTSSSDRVDGDYSLSMEIRSFQIDTTNGRPAADVDIFAKLIDNNSSKVVATKGFGTRVASASDTPSAGVAALNQALTEVLQDTSAWVSARHSPFRSILPTLFIPGLVPGIHVFCAQTQNVDGRDKPGHEAELL